MTDVQWEHYPLVTQMPRAQAWLHMQAHLGLAPNTVAAYGRALNDYLAFCQRHAMSVEAARKEQIAQYVHDLTSRPNPRGSTIRLLDSGAGLANATLQQRLTVIRLFYAYLVEEGHRLGVVRRGERKEVLKGFQSTAHSTLASVLILPYQKVDGKIISTFGCLRHLLVGHKVIGPDCSQRLS